MTAPVETPAGPKPIQDLKVGDEILSVTPGGEIAAGRITAIRSAVVERVMLIELDGGVMLRVTAEHPLALRDEWKRAGELRVGDLVRCKGAIRRISALTHETTKTTVFDLTVEPHHNFFATGVLVHNALKKK